MNLALIELLFVGAVALGFGVWQLYDVNRAIRRDKQARRAGSEDPDGGR